MQLNTLVRLGSLAFDIAQDENVQDLVGMVHRAGKRRGLWAQPAPVTSSSGDNSAKKSKNQVEVSTKQAGEKLKSKSNGTDKQEIPAFIPFGPSWTEPPAWTKLPQAKGIHLPPAVGKRLTARNARQAVKWAEEIGRFLIK